MLTFTAPIFLLSVLYHLPSSPQTSLLAGGSVCLHGGLLTFRSTSALRSVSHGPAVRLCLMTCLVCVI